MKWPDIKENILTTRIIQAKTGLPVTLTLHPIARKIIDRQRAKIRTRSRYSEEVFILPTADGANKILAQWVKAANINKHVTWSCARLSFSILLQDKNVDDATIAYLLGHTTTEQVRKTYKRHRPKSQEDSISQLPTPEQMPYFLNIGSKKRMATQKRWPFSFCCTCFDNYQLIFFTYPAKVPLY